MTVPQHLRDTWDHEWPAVEVNAAHCAHTPGGHL